MFTQKTFIFVKENQRCQSCGICSTIIRCPGEGSCIGCGACYWACPNKVFLKTSKTLKEEINIIINNERMKVPKGITIKEALVNIGYKFTKDPKGEAIFTPCETGGCYACAVILNGQLKPVCHSELKEGAIIRTSIPNHIEPLRIVHGFQPHMVGGVGTPWKLKKKHKYIEVACFTAGCNFRCPTCQNFTTTYNSKIQPITPLQAAAQLTMVRNRYNVNRMAISGGEPTLNRKWLVRFFRELKRLNEDQKARLHLDTNASILTEDYIDDLIEAGITDIGPDLKSHNQEIFSKIIGIKDDELVKTYMERAWSSVKYIADNYFPKDVFMGVGLPYNNYFYPNFDLIHDWGTKLYKINPEIQVSVLDYRPVFRNHKINRPSVDEMLNVKSVLEGAGLKNVIVQTVKGHIGP